MDFLIFIISMFALIKGADFIIIESEKIAIHKNIPKYIIGATLLAFGTSSPELAASISSAYQNHTDMAIANVVGSNIFNIAFILGLSFLIAKSISPDRDIFAKDSAWTIIPLAFYFLAIFDGKINRIEGILLLSLAVAYVLFLINNPEESEMAVDSNLEKEEFNWLKSILLLIVGFIMLIFGADFAIDSASNIARVLGASEWFIGMFLIGFGTSLPEVIVSIKAALRNSADMAIGNVIGSNIANITMVLGGAATVNTLTINLDASLFDNIAMALISLVLIFITANKLYNKSSGFALLVIFGIVLYNALGTQIQ